MGKQRLRTLTIPETAYHLHMHYSLICLFVPKHYLLPESEPLIVTGIRRIPFMRAL